MTWLVAIFVILAIALGFSICGYLAYLALVSREMVMYLIAYAVMIAFIALVHSTILQPHWMEMFR